VQAGSTNKAAPIRRQEEKAALEVLGKNGFARLSGKIVGDGVIAWARKGEDELVLSCTQKL